MNFDFENVYLHIGYLLYGLASCDKGLSLRDQEKLNQLIEGSWGPGSNGDHTFKKHLTTCIRQGINHAVDTKMSAANALDRFRNYFLTRSYAFGTRLRNKILSSVRLIVENFRGADASNEVDREIQALLESQPVMI
jgi:hypothetical protein